jgi:hypothetical protein
MEINNRPFSDNRRPRLDRQQLRVQRHNPTSEMTLDSDGFNRSMQHLESLTIAMNTGGNLAA